MKSRLFLMILAVGAGTLATVSAGPNVAVFVNTGTPCYRPSPVFVQPCAPVVRTYTPCVPVTYIPNQILIGPQIVRYSQIATPSRQSVIRVQRPVIRTVQGQPTFKWRR